MAGIIQGRMAPQQDPMQANPQEDAESAPMESAEAPAEQAQEQAAGTEQQGDMSPEGLMAQMHLDPTQKKQLERIVLAGKKVLFSEKTRDMVIEQMGGEGETAQKLGIGVAGLLGMLMRESNDSLPPQMLVPAGIILVAEAADFLSQAGDEIADQDVGAAIDVMVSAILEQFKLDPAKVGAVAGEAMDPAAAPAQPAPPPPGGGLVGGAMQGAA